MTVNAFTAIASKFDANKNGIEFGEFVGMCAYILICTRLLSKYDKLKDGQIHCDINGLLSLGLWFF